MRMCYDHLSFNVNRMKALETEPISHDEIQRAAGMGSYKQPRKFEIKTILNKDALLAQVAETKIDVQ